MAAILCGLPREHVPWPDAGWTPAPRRSADVQLQAERARAARAAVAVRSPVCRDLRRAGGAARDLPCLETRIALVADPAQHDRAAADLGLRPVPLVAQTQHGVAAALQGERLAA